jgi:hypothetical protein
MMRRLPVVGTRFMQTAKSSSVAWVCLGFALAMFLAACSHSSEPVALPHAIDTIAGGYPFALQIKNRLAKDAYLADATVELAREGGRLQVVLISYGFVSSKGRGRIFTVYVDNVNRQAFTAMDSDDVPHNPRLRPGAWPPLDVPAIFKEIPEVLDIANTNGLGEYCSLIPEKSGLVGLKLARVKENAVWHIAAQGGNANGMVAVLEIRIDAVSGAVLSQALHKTGPQL